MPGHSPAHGGRLRHRAGEGITKKLLKKIIKERDLDRKIQAITDDLEPDELSEHQMLMEKLGEFANTPLGKAALASVPHAAAG